MKADNIKKALECCRHSDSSEEYCADCPYRTVKYCAAKISEDALALITEQEQRIKKFTVENDAVLKRYTIQVATAIKLDKQVQLLTEENEKLRADIAKEFTCVFGQPHKVTNCPIDDEIAKAKADTVREIFDLVECAFSPVLVYEGQTIKRYIAELKKKYTE